MNTATQGAICSIGMMLFFTGLMTIGFWLRHGHWVWEALA